MSTICQCSSRMRMISPVVRACVLFSNTSVSCRDRLSQNRIGMIRHPTRSGMRQPISPALAVHIGAEDHSAERARQRRDAVGAERDHQSRQLISRGEKRERYVICEIGIDEKIVELEKIAAGRADDGADFSSALG